MSQPGCCPFDVSLTSGRRACSSSGVLTAVARGAQMGLSLIGGDASSSVGALAATVEEASSSEVATSKEVLAETAGATTSDKQWMSSVPVEVLSVVEQEKLRQAIQHWETEHSEDFKKVWETDDAASDDVTASLSCSTAAVSDAAQPELEQAFELLNNYVPVKKHSLLKKYLTPEVFAQCKSLVTKNGATLMDVIRSGTSVLESSCGVYLPDKESLRVYEALLGPIISDYHSVAPETLQPALDFGNADEFATNLDPTGEFVVSTRIRCARNVEGYGMHPILKEADYLRMEKEISTSLQSLTGDLKGKYYPLEGMSEETKNKLIEDHFLFAQDDDCLKTANASNFWPKGRGIFHNDEKTFLVWVNEEDQLRIISMEQGCDVKKIYERWAQALTAIEQVVPFARDEKYGYVTFCPTNLGTSIRASVMIKLPKLAKNKAQLDEECAKLGLQVRGMHGEHSSQEGCTFDISNKRRLGLTEFQAVKEMYDGVAKIIALEKSVDSSASVAA